MLCEERKTLTTLRPCLSVFRTRSFVLEPAWSGWIHFHHATSTNRAHITSYPRDASFTRDNQVDFLFLVCLPPSYSPRHLCLWQKTRYPKRRVLIFSRLPRLDLAGDSTPVSAVSTFPNSRVAGGRNVGIGKGNVRPRVYTGTLCIHRPHSRVPLLAGFLLSGTESLAASQTLHPLSLLLSSVCFTPARARACRR